MKEVANRPTEEELELCKKMGTVHEASRRIIEGGGFFIFQEVIDTPAFRDDLIAFARNYVPSALNYAALLKWLQDNNLERFIRSGSLEKSIKEQEAFYQRFYGNDFRINRKKISIDARRLPAIKAGLEAGCLNYVLLKVTPETLSEAEAQMTGAEFFFERIMKQRKNSGFRIWAETGTDRWTKLTLAELLQRCNPAEPEEFDAESFERDWVVEEKSVIEKKVPAPKVKAGSVEIVFTSNLVDIPSDQKIVNKDGKIVEPSNRSYVSAIARKVRVLSHEEGIILESQSHVNDGKAYLAPNTWEWRRDLILHEDKDANPVCSVASARSHGGGFYLHSSSADGFCSYYRLRLAL